MTDRPLTFAEWIPFEAERIVGLGLMAAAEHRAEWMRLQIEAALKKAAAHSRDGLTDADPPRAVC